MVKSPSEDAEQQNRRRIAGLVKGAREALPQIDERLRQTLREMAPGKAKTVLPDADAAHLIALGLVERKLGGHVLTGMGKVAADMLARGA